jgi:SpoIIAA-like
VEVVASADGLILARARAGLVRQKQAQELCAGIESSASGHESPRLLMDLRALSRATPAAGLYALRQLRTFPVERIGLVGANRFMRLFASLVLRLGAFPRHRFFDDEARALEWLNEGPSPQAKERP